MARRKTSGHLESEAAGEAFDLVVIGAGIAGLNALHAAKHYLPNGAAVLLIDEKPTPGGMWNLAYDYVRLHQPHPMFTVGDIRWSWSKPRTYLAKGDEVRDHLAATLEAVAEGLNLKTCFGHTAVAAEEVQTAGGCRARIRFHPNDRPGQTRTVETVRAIHASGLNYHVPKPLPFSSASVVSAIPQTLSATLADNPGAAVYVVGGGKTGMDTVLAVLAEDPRRQMSLINGRGTNFLNREKYFPTGVRRWASGNLVSGLFRDLALTFDGTNENELLAHLRRHHAVDPNSTNTAFLYGLLSQDEHRRITAGLTRTYHSYLMDVSDSAAGPQIELRDGTREPVIPGSIFVNCTGSFFRTADMEAERPCVSPHGTVLSLTMRDGFHFLTSVAAFTLTHLLYRNTLRRQSFYTLDHEALFRQNRNAWVGASAAQAYMNEVLTIQTLPMRLLEHCGLDLDQWYPRPRRIVGLLRMKATADRDIGRCRLALDRVAGRFGIHCAELE